MASLKALLMSDSPPEYIVHMMAWHYRQLLRGKELTSAGLTPDDAAVKLGKRYSGLKEKFARQLRRASDKNIVKALEALSDCDRELKRGQISSEVLLDRLVLELLV
jgi:DNA polymerase III delta subunit